MKKKENPNVYRPTLREGPPKEKMEIHIIKKDKDKPKEG